MVWACILTLGTILTVNFFEKKLALTGDPALEPDFQDLSNAGFPGNFLRLALTKFRKSARWIDLENPVLMPGLP